MAAFETLLKVPAIHPIEVLLDPDNGSVVIAQRATPHGSRFVVQIPAHALRDVVQSLETAMRANRGGDAA